MSKNSIKLSSQSRGQLRTLLILGNAPRYYLEVALIVGVGMMAAILYPLRPTSEATAVLSLFIIAGFRLLPSLNRALVALSAIRASQPSLERVTTDLAVLEAEGVGDYSAVRQPLGSVTVEFDSVSFAYSPEGPRVIRELDFRIDPGESVAFVGASGSGKTTLLDVLLGLLDATEGTVLVDEVPIADARQSWQLSVGYVPQDVVLLDDTLRINVALGTPSHEIDDAEVERALAMAELTESWQSLPQGLDTRLGERGVRLSGGQRQRVGIARALYHHPAVLVLDEATSSLDSTTESRITQTIDALQRTLTVIIVTHRLSTVRNCDRIYLLDEGAITASGRFRELVAGNTVFADLVRRSSVEEGQ